MSLKDICKPISHLKHVIIKDPKQELTLAPTGLAASHNSTEWRHRLKVSQIQSRMGDLRWSRPAGGREGQRLRGGTLEEGTWV